VVHAEQDPAVEPVSARDPEVAALLDALTAELALGGYTPDETFGYSAEQLERSAVHLVGARVDGRLVGVGGLEVQPGGVGELKRFFVRPGHRGRGVADVLVAALLEHARAGGTHLVRLETGDEQRAAIAFYRRHGFVEIPRFGPYVHSATSYCMERAVDPRP
jgi:putative acetyltransferase